MRRERNTAEECVTACLAGIDDLRITTAASGSLPGLPLLTDVLCPASPTAGPAEPTIRERSMTHPVSTVLARPAVQVTSVATGSPPPPGPSARPEHRLL